MTLDELDALLDEEGFGPLITERGPRLIAIGDLRLDARGHGFYVGIAERGVMQWPFLSTSNEDVACRRFLERAGELYQCLVSVRERTDIEALQAALESAEITVWRNDIPNFDGHPRYRIFVLGRDLRIARRIVADSGVDV